MYCSHCGSVLDDGAQFGSHCGAKLTANDTVASGNLVPTVKTNLVANQKVLPLLNRNISFDATLEVYLCYRHLFKEAASEISEDFVEQFYVKYRDMDALILKMFWMIFTRKKIRQTTVFTFIGGSSGFIY